MVGERGFEPPTPWSRTRCSTRLSHSPNLGCGSVSLGRGLARFSPECASTSVAESEQLQGRPLPPQTSHQPAAPSFDCHPERTQRVERPAVAFLVIHALQRYRSSRSSRNYYPSRRANPARPGQSASCRPWVPQSPQYAGAAWNRPSTPARFCRNYNLRG